MKWLHVNKDASTNCWLSPAENNLFPEAIIGRILSRKLCRLQKRRPIFSKTLDVRSETGISESVKLWKLSSDVFDGD
jgi:hypothetical protein